LTLKKFTELGSFSRFKNEKQVLLQYIETYFQNFDKKCSNFCLKKNNDCFIKYNYEMTNTKYHQSNLDVNVSKVCSFDKNNYSFMLKKFFMANVEKKYIDHWNWLFHFFGYNSEKFLSFHLLLLNGYELIN
jgi:hypothetical protein